MFAALHLPDLPVIAALRSSPALRQRPCAVLPVSQRPDDPKEKLPLLAVNAVARGAGIVAGWQLNRARVRCPGLELLPRQPVAEAALLAELIEQAESLTPDLEITAPDTLLLDLSRAGAGRIAQLADLFLPDAEVHHALAATPDLARLAVLDDATQGGFNRPSDVTRLPLARLSGWAGANDLMPLLELWGLATVGDFQRLPRQALAERLGPVAGHWHDLVHGRVCRLLRLHRPPPSFFQSLTLEEPLHLIEPLIFLLKKLLHTLSARLAARHLAAGELKLTLRLECGESLTRHLRLPEPLIDAVHLLRPLQTHLETVRLRSAVIGIELDATPTAPTTAQREWFGRQLSQPERWAETLAQAVALLGPERVGIPVPSASHQPDAFTLRPPPGSLAQALPEPVSPFVVQPPASIPLRRFRPPRPVSVAFDSRPQGPWPLALLSGPHPGEIVDRRGPFLSSGHWWNSQARWQRQEWDIQTASQHLLRLVFLPPAGWQLDGIYG
jgi:protein ImuB